MIMPISLMIMPIILTPTSTTTMVVSIIILSTVTSIKDK
jgi:hypothetical protein